MNLDEFIEKAKKIHGDKYDYSKVNYISSKLKIDIICSTHGIFSQRASNHLLGNGCKKCNIKIPINTNKQLTTEKFIQRAKEVHGDKYDYSLVEYINSHKKVKIKCGDHIFEQRADQHLSGNGCHICSKSAKMNTEIFIKKAIEIHKDLYDYSLVEYTTNNKKVKIICKKHGIFETRANNHISKLKRGCPNCRTSKNEILISNLLKNKNIDFIPQKYFEECKYIKKLYFDFYLPKYNICIEYDGKQHYENIYNSNQEFRKIQLRDNIKDTYCKDNNISLLRIRYDENVEEKINNFISKFF